MSPRRHGAERNKQRNFALGEVTGFRVHGISKQITALSIGQLRNMFPQFALLGEQELRIAASKEFENRKNL